MTEPSPARSASPPWVPVAAVLLLTAAVLPCVVPLASVAYFDTDPRQSMATASGGGIEPLIALGPVGLTVWQWLTTLFSAAVLAVGWWHGGDARPSRRGGVAWVVGLAVAGAIAMLWHLVKADSRWEDWQQAGQWISAATAGLAAWRLGRFPAARRWAVALGCAALVPLLLEAGHYVAVEHPMSVRFFESHREELLAARGMEPGSMQAVLYERRLRFADATGPYGLSNVLASVAGSLAMLGLVGAWWTLRPRGDDQVDNRSESASVAARRAVKRSGVWVAGGCGLGGGLTVWLTGSKGAVVAGALVLGLTAVTWAVWRRLATRRWRWVVPTAMLLLVGLAVGATVGRGAMGPPAPPEVFEPGAEVSGERSLLFRAQYWSAAARMIGERPMLGVGPRGFAEHYLRLKDPLNPETVTSSHNVIVDLVSMLGVGGLAWCGLLLAGLWGAGRGVADGGSARAIGASGPDAISAGRLAGLSTGVVFGVGLWVLRPGLYVDTAVLWLVAAGGYAVVAAWLGGRGRLSEAGTRWGLFAGAGFALLHNQVEMSFVQPGSVMLLCVVVGLAAGGGGVGGREAAEVEEKASNAGRWWGLRLWRVGGVAALVLPVGMLTAILVGTIGHESAMRRAAEALQRGRPAAAVEALGQAERAAGFDSRALHWRVRLHAAEPMAALVERGRQGEAEARVARAEAWMDQADGRAGPTAATARLRTALLERWGQLTDDAAALRRAWAAAGQLAELSPYNVGDAMVRAELAERLLSLRGDGGVTPEQVRALFERVWRLRQSAYLDASDPLTPTQLRRLREVTGREE